MKSNVMSQQGWTTWKKVALLVQISLILATWNNPLIRRARKEF